LPTAAACAGGIPPGFAVAAAAAADCGRSATAECVPNPRAVPKITTHTPAATPIRWAPCKVVNGIHASPREAAIIARENETIHRSGEKIERWRRTLSKS
jgi:hypothetical protein